MRSSESMVRPRLPSTVAAARSIAAFNKQRVKTQKELTEKYRLENAITRADYLERSAITKGLAVVADAIVSRVMSADIPRAVKDDLLKDIASIPLILEEVAHGQSRHTARKKQKAEPDKVPAEEEE